MKNWKTILLLSALFLAACTAARGSTPDASLWDGIAEVESHHRRDAINGNAVGIVQIMPATVEDINRILRHKKYTLDDRYNVEKSREMFVTYLTYYSLHTLRKQGKPESYENLARIWYGGPGGWESPAAMRYWQKVHRAMENPQDKVK